MCIFVKLETDKHPFKGSFSGQPGEAGTTNVKPIWILMKQEVMGWHWHPLDHMQIVGTFVQTDNHARTSWRPANSV